MTRGAHQPAVADPGDREGRAGGQPRTDADTASWWSALRRQLFDAREWHHRFARLYDHADRLASASAKGTLRKVLARHSDISALTGLGMLLLRERRYDEAVVVWEKATALKPQAVGPAFQLARALHRSGRLEPAALQYLRVLALDPIHDKAFEALENLSHRFARAGQTGGNIGEASAAARIGQQLLALQPGSARARQSAEAIAKAIVTAASALVARAPDIALAQFAVALDLAADLPEALRGTAQCYERLGRADQALEVWERLGGMDPQEREAIVVRARGFAAVRDTAGRGRRRGHRRLAESEPEGQLLLRRARSAYSAARLEDAEALLQRLLVLDGLDPGALLLLSRLYVRQQNWPEAITVLTRLGALQPDSAEAREMLARALLHDGQFEAAAQVYEALHRQRPDSREVLEALGRVYARLRDWSGACRVLRRLVELDPSRPQPRLFYGRALHQAGNIAEAETQLQSALETNPREGEALALLARIHSKTDPEGAVEYWSRLAGLNRSAAEPLLQIARIRARQRRSAEARQFFQAVLERDPNHAEALAGFGHALAETDQSAAVSHFTRWAERQPDDAAARLELARLYQKAREWDRAEEVYRQILEIDPHNDDALARFAQLLSRDHVRIDHALDLWRRIGERDPAASFPIVQRAYLFERLRRFDGAEAEYRAALDRAPDDTMALIGLARLFSNQARWGEAAELFETVHRVNPDRTDALLGLGRSLERLNRGDDALAAYQKVLAIDPANGNALLYRGRLLRQLGRVEQAIEEWRRVCAMAPQNADAWHELVFMLASAERELEALAALDKAEAALPASAPSWARLGLACQAAQFHDRAVAYFERAIAGEPQEASHQAQLGQYYFRQGIIDDAFHHLLASRELRPADLPVAKRLVETVHIVNDLGVDHIALHKAPPTTGEILVPERLFALVRQIADTQVIPYDPVPRRIVAVSASLAGGGAERQLVNMLHGLSGPGFDLELALFCISLASRTGRDFFLPQLAGTPVEVVTPAEGAVETYLQAPEAAPYARLIRRFPEDMVGPIAFWLGEFRRRRPQIVHAWQDSTNLTACVAALLAGVPRIILGTRSVRPDNPRRRLKRFMKEAYQAVLGHKSVVLNNNSRAGADDYADWLGLDPAAIEVVYNGIDFDRLERSVDPVETRRARAELGIPPDAPVLGSAFRMSEEKRPLLWIEVAAAVARQNPQAHFIVCGDGPMRTDMLDLAAARGIADRVHLPGPQANIASWYKAMDVVMLTSRHEGLPNVLLEAQCLGVPVVAPDVGGMSETVWQGVTGWTIRHADASDLAERVLSCLSDPAWREAARAAAPGFVKERFGMETMLRRTLEVYGMAQPDEG